MAVFKKTNTIIAIGDKTQTVETEYAIVSTFEVEKMLQKVAQGENENKLREELIKKTE